MNGISLQPWNLRRTERLLWIFPTSSQPLLERIPSKSVRKFLAHTASIVEHNDIAWTIQPITEAEYVDWHQFYVAKMQEQNHEAIARQDWYASRVAQGKTILGIEVKQHGQRIGMGIISESDTTITLAYKAAGHLDISGLPNANLGSLIEYWFLEYAYIRGKVISSGASRNAFGVINTVGYLDFKLRFGYQPTFTPEKAQYHHDVPVNDQGWVLFYGLPADGNHQELRPYLLHNEKQLPYSGELQTVRQRLSNLTVLSLV